LRARIVASHQHAKGKEKQGQGECHHSMIDRVCSSFDLFTSPHRGDVACCLSKEQACSLKGKRRRAMKVIQTKQPTCSKKWQVQRSSCWLKTRKPEKMSVQFFRKDLLLSRQHFFGHGGWSRQFGRLGFDFTHFIYLHRAARGCELCFEYVDKRNRSNFADLYW
jgi:hypothetical protein